jgi:hypothetical protein
MNWRIKEYKESITQSWFFEKISRINKHLAKLTKRKRENIQINKIRDEKEDMTKYH